MTDSTTVPGWLPRLVEEAGQAGGAHRQRSASNGAGRKSAVLILFGASAGGGELPDVVLLERAHTLRSHAGQIAFPGGALDPEDSGPEAAALREAEEETGLDPDGVRVVGRLPDLYVSPSDFLVTPVVGWWQRPTPLRAVDQAEVASVHRVPVAELVDPGHRFTVRLPSGYRGPAFWLGDLIVWGFTGGILDQLFTVAGWSRDWDRRRVEDLPERLVELAMRGRG